MLTLLVSAVVLAWLAETVLDVMNHRAGERPLDAQVAGLYDAEQQAKSRAYATANYQFGLVIAAAETAVIVLALVAGWFGALDAWVRDRVEGPILVPVAYLALLALLRFLLTLPASLYSTFVLEARFGFNRTTPGTYIADILKGTVVGVVLGGGLLTAIVWLYDQLGASFWLATWVLITVFSVFMFMAGTALLLPLFNKLTPLPDGELRHAIEQYCDSQGYRVRRLYVMDGSKRSSKANAFFSGLGRVRTIVLFDTLIEKLTVEQVVAVLAHEVGHDRLRHTRLMLLTSMAQTFLLAAVFGWFVQAEALAVALGGQQASFHLGVLAFLFILSPFNLLVGWFTNSLSRRHEFSADQFAVQTYGGAPLRKALEIIGTDALVNLSPHPAYVAVHYTHPPMASRLARLADAA